jgi:hypothetical protein
MGTSISEEYIPPPFSGYNSELSEEKWYMIYGQEDWDWGPSEPIR